jgi:hypothetical protein
MAMVSGMHYTHKTHPDALKQATVQQISISALGVYHSSNDTRCWALCSARLHFVQQICTFAEMSWAMRNANKTCVPFFVVLASICSDGNGFRDACIPKPIANPKPTLLS